MGGEDDLVVNGAVVTGALSKALDAVVWDGLETRSGTDPVEDVARALRRLSSAGTEAVEEDCYPLYSLVTRDGCETPSAAAVALPFVIALAADPAMGVRVDLVDLLAALHAPALAGEDWSGAWALLADPEPTVRRAATALPAGVARLLERWRVETDPTVRLPLLLALGEAASREAAPAEAGEPAREARAVLAGVLDSDDPVLRVAAVHASAELDRELPVRQLDRLIEVFSDLALRPRFESVWYTPDIEAPWTREDLVRSTARLLGHDPEAELSFAVRLVESARRSGDGALCREALDLAWRLLTERRSVESSLLPLAGMLLADPDGAVRLRAANILAVLGPAAAPYADRLAELLDDDATDPYLDGSVREIARWALTRIGDPRALPGLVEQLRAQEEEQGRGYVIGDPRRPDTKDVLIPLRAHADTLLPAIRETIRHCGARGGATRSLLPVLEAWGEDALPALPDLIPLLADTWTSIDVMRVLLAIGPAAAPAVPAVLTSQVLDHPGNHRFVARTAARLGADRAEAPRLVGEAVMRAEEPELGPIGGLCEFGRDAAPYAQRVRLAMEHSTHWPRLTAAITLWEITGRAEPTLRVLEEFVLPIADGGDGFGLFGDALRALIRMGEISPAIREALLAVRHSDRRLSAEGGYPMVLRDQELRGLIEEAMACAALETGGTP
ncbi:HEAT repeat domain-containing protein [Streptomyces flavotricini]|uniref:HEAT repeat domain-containing protein n=1 Tax=Streptomyces flavotricini TaxID=66888 RepID=A0ABS8DY80_9ACTN|nr:HEAT repeat domain-containing protein [Streptomyces flavotricini]MCC0093623.1 HEAT repeat domain-containing protein [Streptomyces flavotricini]